MTLIIADKNNLYSDRRACDSNGRFYENIPKFLEVKTDGKRVALVGMAGELVSLQIAQKIIKEIAFDDPFNFLRQLRKKMIEKGTELHIGKTVSATDHKAAGTEMVMCDGENAYEMDVYGCILKHDVAMIGSGATIAEHMRGILKPAEVFKFVHEKTPLYVGKDFDHNTIK